MKKENITKIPCLGGYVIERDGVVAVVQALGKGQTAIEPKLNLTEEEKKLEKRIQEANYEL
jgi:hypothetical protein